MPIAIAKNLFLVLTAFSLSAHAQELFRAQEKVSAFKDHGKNGGVLLISQDGSAYRVRNGKVSAERYHILQAECVPDTQNTSMNDQGMTLATPYLVGVGRACLIDEQKKEIRKISQFDAQLPSNAFSVSYAGEDANSSYFVINGRPWETTGYLLGLSIDKRTSRISIREVVSEVPGFSGAMLLEDDTLWITVWNDTNEIYRASAAELRALAASGGKIPFRRFATSVFRAIEGMSAFALINSDGFLYYNEGYESYWVARAGGRRATASPRCEPISGDGSKWQVLCERQVLESVEADRL